MGGLAGSHGVGWVGGRLGVILQSRVITQPRTSIPIYPIYPIYPNIPPQTPYTPNISRHILMAIIALFRAAVIP